MGTRSRFVAIAHCLFRTIDCPGLFLVAARYGEQLERLSKRISAQHPALLTPGNVDHRRDLEGTDQVFSGVLSEHDELLCLHGRLLCSDRNIIGTSERWSSANLLDLQRTCWQRMQEIGLIAGLFQPC